MTAIMPYTDCSHCRGNNTGVQLYINGSTMKIYISEEAIIKHIQHDFQKIYPYLKLEFYRNSHEIGKGSPADERISPDMPIEKVRMANSFGWIDISEHLTAAQLESDFRKRLGLYIQVLRRAGDLWLTTTRTDNRTLKQLNEEGKPAERHRFNFPEEPVE